MGEMSGEQLVDAIEAASGRHPGKRRAHAMGIVATGTFTATPAAAGLTTAAAMQGGGTSAVPERAAARSGRWSVTQV